LGPEHFDEAFEGLDLRGQPLEGIEFNGCTFVSCQLAGVRLKGTRFIDCTIKDSDLSNADVKGAGFCDVRVFGSKLIGIDWTAATRVQHLAFERSVLSYGNFTALDLRKLKMTDCVVREAFLTEANLAEADCRRSDFAGARFSRTNLTKADFRGAQNYAIRADDNLIKKARFSLPEAVALLHGLEIRLDD
jgi:uncharacterized protein YjbI with pentapeptide repeats